MPTDLEKIGLQIPCPYCEAQPGDWCRTAALAYLHAPGRRAAWLHTARMQPVYDAWQYGFRSMELNAARNFLQDQPWFKEWAERVVREHETGTR